MPSGSNASFRARKEAASYATKLVTILKYGTALSGKLLSQRPVFIREMMLSMRLCNAVPHLKFGRVQEGVFVLLYITDIVQIWVEKGCLNQVLLGCFARPRAEVKHCEFPMHVCSVLNWFHMVCGMFQVCLCPFNSIGPQVVLKYTERDRLTSYWILCSSAPEHQVCELPVFHQGVVLLLPRPTPIRINILNAGKDPKHVFIYEFLKSRTYIRFSTSASNRTSSRIANASRQRPNCAWLRASAKRSDLTTRRDTLLSIKSSNFQANAKALPNKSAIVIWATFLYICAASRAFSSFFIPSSCLSKTDLDDASSRKTAFSTSCCK